MNCGIISSARRRSAAGGGGFGSHRYWRIFVTQNAGDATNTEIAEIEFHSTVGGSDITGSGTALSGGSGTDGAGNANTNAFDNSAATTWLRSSPTNTWIGYDFGSTVTVAEVSITATPTGGAFARSPQSFTLDYSDNGSTWTTATGGTFTAYGWLVSQARTYPETTPAAGFHRFWRLFCTDNNGGTSFVGIGDVELRATAGGADQTTALGSNNGSSSGRIVGSTITLGGDEGYRAFDDSASSTWLGGTIANEWVGFIFPNPVTVHQAMLQASTSVATTRMVKNGKIEWSDDHDKVGGGSWTTAGSFTQTGWTSGQQITVTVTP